MEGYGAPGTESYAADGTAATGEGNGWYGDSAAQEGAAATEQQGFSIPTTGQTNGGGPMRQGRGGGSRYNPMSRGKPGGGDAGPASAAAAEKNELGYIIFAYNIGYHTDESQLHGIFSPYGSVAKVNVIQDFTTGQGKGFGFVTMPNATEAESAVNSLNGTDFNGNSLQVRFKSPKGQGPPSGRGGARGAGFRGTRGGGFRGGRGAPRGGAGGFRGGRGGPRGGGRGRGRGAYSSAPSAYDGGYGGGGYSDSYGGYGGYADPSGAGYGAAGYGEYADPYAGYSAPAAPGAGYTSYGTGGGQW